MKLSKYTFLFIDDTNYYVYNTLSNALLQIDEISYHTLKNTDEINEKNVDKDLYEILVDKRFVTENFKDDFILYKSMVDDLRSQRKHMHLTIAPTMDCNFSCHYCFEQKEKKYLNRKNIKSIIKHLKQYNDLENIYLTWFGGEPLMAIDQIKEFHKELRDFWKKSFDSNIITTAYHITPQVIKVLKEVEVSSMQITLDGNKEFHNKVKYTDDCNDVFEKVIQNIDLITTTAPEIHVTIRVNLTKENADDYVGLFKYLIQRYNGKNIGIAPAFVNDRGVTSTCDNGIFFKRKDASDFILNLWNNHGIHSPMLRYPDRFINECAIRNKNSLAIDPEGYVYKCWEVIGNKKFAIGKLIDGNICEINETVLNRQLFGGDPIEDKKCSKCSYLPICSGGCPIQRIENEFEGKSNDMCSPIKGYIPEFLKIHLDLKKRNLNNYR